MSKKYLLFFGCFFLFFVVWELSTLSLPYLMFVLPAPSKILITLAELKGRFWLHSWVTFKEMCAGFFLALSASFPLAWIMMQFQTSRAILQPLFIIIQCMPMFTLAPIMVVWFGWGFTAIVVPTALMIFFPLTLNIYQGLRSTPQELVEFFQTNQATRWQIFFKLQLPWATPHFFAGFRVSSAIAGVSAVAGEWAGAQQGLGVLMLESRRNGDLEITFGALFCLTCISTLLYLFTLFCEKNALPPRHWKWPRLSPSLQSKVQQLVFPLLTALAFLLLAGCSCNDEKGTTRLLLDWLPNPNHIPLYVGLEKGFFKESDIPLSIQKMQDGGGGISFLVSKKTDLFVSHMPSTLKASEKGAKVKIIGLLIKEPLCGLIYRDDQAIKCPSDLSHRRFGYCIGLPDMEFLEFLLQKGNIEPSETKNVSVDLVYAMGTKSVDFIYGGFWNIEPAQLASLGMKTKTFKVQDLGVPPYYEMIILANENSPQSNPDFVSRFQSALQKSIDYCVDHPQEAFNIFLLYNQDRASKTIAWQNAAWKMTIPLLAKDQVVDKESVETFYQWQVEQKILSPFDYKRVFILDK